MNDIGDVTNGFKRIIREYYKQLYTHNSTTQMNRTNSSKTIKEQKRLSRLEFLTIKEFKFVT